MSTFNENAAALLVKAQQVATKNRSLEMEAEHVLWADLCQENGECHRILKSTDVTLSQLRSVVDDAMSRLPKRTGRTAVRPKWSSRLREMCSNLEDRLAGNGPRIGWADIINSILLSDDKLSRSIRKLGLEESRITTANDSRLATEDYGQAMSEESAVGRYCIDFTQQAIEGEIHEAIGRDDEIQAVVTILCQKGVNNPLLLGEPGVGKTAIVEGLATIIAKEEKHPLAGKRILSLDLGSLLAGATYRGEFEERLKAVIDEIQSFDDPPILFVDEIHTLMGAGTSEGGADAANLLKPPLARGKLQTIGATTTDEYRAYLEHDKAFTRRFLPVQVEEPTKAETLEILQGIAKGYASFHSVKYSDVVLGHIVELSGRYIWGNRFPDKAIKVLDRVGATVKLNGSRKAVKLEDVTNVVSQTSGIPTENLVPDTDRFKKLCTARLRSIIGQQDATKSLERELMIVQSGLTGKNRPKRVLGFEGPEGVGKSEAAMALADLLCGSASKLIEFDMSGFADSQSRSELFGSARGLVGSERGGRLTESIRSLRNPVIVFSRMNHATLSLQSTLAQFMQKSTIQDNRGFDVNLTQTVFVVDYSSSDQQIHPSVFRSLDAVIKFATLEPEHFMQHCLRAKDSVQAAIEGNGDAVQFEFDESISSWVLSQDEWASGKRLEEWIRGEILRLWLSRKKKAKKYCLSYHKNSLRIS